MTSRSNRQFAAGVCLNLARKLALLVCALAVVPVALVPCVTQYPLAAGLMALGWIQPWLPRLDAAEHA